MPRPPVNPRPGLWRMGAQLCINRVWKSRSISAAIFVVCLWVCLVSVINLASNGRPLSWTTKDETFPSVPLAFPDTLDLITNYYRPVSRVKQSPGPNSRIQLKASTYLTQNGQTDEAIENGIISGRRMQEIKAVEMEGLETVSRVQEKDHAERDLGNILISAVQDQIDGKAITAMGIKQEIKTPRENPKDLPSNWTQEPETKSSPSSLSNVNGFDRSGSEDEPKPDRVISSRAKHEPVGTDRKTRSAEHGKTNISEVADMTLQPDSIIEPADISKLQGGIGTRGLDKGGNSLSNHLLQSIGESHYLQGNFYHRASNGRVEMRIDTRLNGTKMYTPRKIEGSTYSYSSRTPDTASSHSESPQANSDGVKNTHRSEVTQRKSNREIPVAMQMLAPIRIEDFSPPLNVIDRKRKSMTRQIDSGAKHPTLFYPPDDRNGQTASLIQHSAESNSLSSQEGDVLKFALNANNLSRLVLREIRLSAASSTRSNQLSVSGTSSSQQSHSITYSLVNLTSGEPSSRERRPDKKKYQQGSLLFDGFELYSYNVTASDMISLDRSIPDTRPEG
ncbi:polypeptide N-acetylgalactosaminyltransferase 5 [Biomphalaria glabrata]|nr:polypeptide N-acetylgalactosaminyltransferase 5 [Biomphalaria glabrata]